MQTDRELLELAAKAAGYCVMSRHFGAGHECSAWNPLEDDGDALRLAMALCVSTGFDLKIELMRNGALVGDCLEQWNNHQAEATRRAIVRAAAQIGAGKDAT